MKPSPPPFVRVFWRDAHSDQTEYTLDEIPHAAILIESRGWLLRQDDGGVTIFAERLDDTGRITWRGRSFIPAGMIDRVEVARLRWVSARQTDQRRPPECPASTTE